MTMKRNRNTTHHLTIPGPQGQNDVVATRRGGEEGRCTMFSKEYRFCRATITINGNEIGLGADTS